MPLAIHVLNDLIKICAVCTTALHRILEIFGLDTYKLNLLHLMVEYSVFLSRDAGKWEPYRFCSG